MSDIKGFALSVRDGGCVRRGDKQAANGSGGVMMCVWQCEKKERVPPGDPGGPFMGVATTYFPTAFCRIIGATGLHFSVRNGKRWTSAL